MHDPAPADFLAALGIIQPGTPVILAGSVIYATDDMRYFTVLIIHDTDVVYLGCQTFISLILLVSGKCFQRLDLFISHPVDKEIVREAIIVVAVLRINPAANGSGKYLKEIYITLGYLPAAVFRLSRKRHPVAGPHGYSGLQGGIDRKQNVELAFVSK